MPAAAAQLPGPLRLGSSYPSVGRSRGLAALRTLVPHLPGEGRRIALIGGEAGSGKSRLVREFAREAAADGVVVLYGACDAVVRTPYRPFVEALEQLVRGSDVDTLRDDLGPAGGELARLLPELTLRVEGLSDPVSADPDTERHRLHSVVGELWRALLETGALALSEGRLRLTRSLEEIATPESVREVVSQRVSRLDDGTRDLLDLAAVAGTEFELEVLRSAKPDLERPDALDAAVRSGVVDEVPGPTLAYRFTHELVRRAVYDRLSAHRPAELHLLVGNAIEATDAGSGRLLADLANHFAAAALL